MGNPLQFHVLTQSITAHQFEISKYEKSRRNSWMYGQCLRLSAHDMSLTSCPWIIYGGMCRGLLMPVTAMRWASERVSPTVCLPLCYITTRTINKRSNLNSAFFGVHTICNWAQRKEVENVSGSLVSKQFPVLRTLDTSLAVVCDSIDGRVNWDLAQSSLDLILEADNRSRTKTGYRLQRADVTARDFRRKTLLPPINRRKN